METPVRPGDILLGKYRVEHLLGQGGMGVVVAARHIELAELFAIKFLLPQALESEQAFERFLREARAAARLKGEHVAKVHDVGRLESGAPYMVMEHLEGMDLQKVVRTRGPLPAPEAVLYVLQACDAVAEAHARGIVHRDLKPANLFLTQRHDGTPCIKVLDFGISKQRTHDSLELTTTGMVLGSPFYMSPEQMIRAKQVDLRSDVWSMGVVLYKLLTGRVPFTAEVLTELVGRVLQDDPPRPSQLRSDLGPALDAVILHCLEKRPEQRFATMGALASALRSLPAASAIATTTEALGNTAQPAKPALETPAPATGIASTTYSGTTWARTRATAPARGKTGAVAGAVAALVVLGGGGAWLGLRSGASGASLLNPAATSTVAAAMTTALAPPSSAAPSLPDAAEPPASRVEIAPTEPAVPAAEEQTPPATAVMATTLRPPAVAANPAPVKGAVKGAATTTPSSNPVPAKTTKSAAPAAPPPKHEAMF